MRIFPRLLLPVLALSLAGCAVTSSPIDRFGNQDVMNGQRWGAIIGTAGGAVIGNNTKLGKERGARLGEFAGAAIGTAVGLEASKRRAQFASESAFLEAEIASSKRAVSNKQNGLSSLRAELRDSSAEVSNLERRHRANQNVSGEVASKLREVNSRIQSNESVMAGYQQTIAYIDEVIASSRKQSGASGLESKRNELADKRSRLQSQFNALHGINEEFLAQKRKLERMSNVAGQSGGTGSQLPFGIPNLNIPNATDFIPFGR